MYIQMPISYKPNTIKGKGLTGGGTPLLLQKGLGQTYLSSDDYEGHLDRKAESSLPTVAGLGRKLQSLSMMSGEGVKTKTQEYPI